MQGRAEGGIGGENSRGPGILGARQIYLQKKIYTKQIFSLSDQFSSHIVLNFYSRIMPLKNRFRGMNL